MADEQLKQQKIKKTKATKLEKNLKDLNQIPVEDKKNEKKVETKIEKETSEKKGKKEVKVKKTEAEVNGKNLRISTKHAKYIAKFIKYKKIDEAIDLLNKVIKKKIAVPFKGELPHRKGNKLNGKGMVSGKYPYRASKEFVVLLKSLLGNVNSNGMDPNKTIIIEVITNKSPNQFHRFGSEKFKRTHVYIKAKEISEKTKNKGEKK
ncbi:MAG TPA: uL22 family ribosomal protein [Candidatus Paceibacterota bacterium]|nr:uL22 family ribosomal protein [Candidatus Paceibacterota bacterium]